jgi:hypothetical protein
MTPPESNALMTPIFSYHGEKLSRFEPSSELIERHSRYVIKGLAEGRGLAPMLQGY